MVAPEQGQDAIRAAPRSKLMAQLFGSTATAQLAALVATGVAATQATPRDFALYATTAAAAAVVASVSSLSAETRIPVVSDHDAAAMTRAGFGANCLVVALVLTAGVLAKFLRPEWTLPALLIGSGIFVVSLNGLCISLAIRAHRQELLAWGRLAQGFVNAGVIVALIFSSLPGYLVLTGAWIASVASSAGLILRGLPGRPPLTVMASRADFRLLFARVRVQPLNSLLANLGTSLPALMLPALGAIYVAGVWALVTRVLNAVTSTIVGALAPVYVGDLARSLRTQDTSGMANLRRAWLSRLLLLVPLMTTGTVVGCHWILPLLGPEWGGTRNVTWQAAVAFSALVFWLPISQTLILIGETGRELAWSVANVIVTSLGLAVGSAVNGHWALGCWALATALGIGAHILLQTRSLRRLSRDSTALGALS